jgi:hypothetical protein
VLKYDTTLAALFCLNHTNAQVLATEFPDVMEYNGNGIGILPDPETTGVVNNHNPVAPREQAW